MLVFPTVLVTCQKRFDKSDCWDYDVDTICCCHVVLLATVSHTLMVLQHVTVIYDHCINDGLAVFFCLQGPLCTKRCMTTASTWKDMVGKGSVRWALSP